MKISHKIIAFVTLLAFLSTSKAHTADWPTTAPYENYPGYAYEQSRSFEPGFVIGALVLVSIAAVIFQNSQNDSNGHHHAHFN